MQDEKSTLAELDTSFLCVESRKAEEQKSRQQKRSL